MAVHVSNWERFAEWAESKGIVLTPCDQCKAHSVMLCTLTTTSVVHRSFPRSALRSSGLRPSWQSNVLTLITRDCWAIQNEVISKRAKTLKEGCAHSHGGWCDALELFVMDEVEPQAACTVHLVVACAWCLHRSDMTTPCTFKPGELTMSEEGMFGVAWQTKVEREKKGYQICCFPMLVFLGLIGSGRVGVYAARRP